MMSRDQYDGHSEKVSFEDTVLNKLESLCNVFDNIYFLKNIGILSEDNFIFNNKIFNNKNKIGSKIWLLTLILTIRKSSKHLIKVFKTRYKLKYEINHRNRINGHLNDNGNEIVDNILLNKLQKALTNCNYLLIDIILELIQNLIYLIITIIDIFNVPKRLKSLKRFLEPLSILITMFRLFSNSYSIIQ